MPTIKKPLKKTVLVVSLFYGLYLLKTMLGINLSSNVSAHWLMKAPLEPIEASQKHLCKEIQVGCIKRRQIRNKIRRGIKRII